MINENRVKRIYKIALYEQKEEKEKQLVENYFRSDYIGKELLKSFFTGTMAYVVMVVFWGMCSWFDLLEQIHNLEIINTIVNIVILYIIFLFLYLLVTGIVYTVRYKHSKAKNDVYVKNLKRVYQMYEREEKLKM